MPCRATSSPRNCACPSSAGFERTELGSFVGQAEAETFAAAVSLRVLDGTGPNRVVLIDRANRRRARPLPSP